MTPDKLAAARQLLFELPEGEDRRDALYAHWFHETGEGQVVFPDPAAYQAAGLHPAAFEPGWRVIRTGLPGLAAQVEVEKAGRTRFVAPPNVTPTAERAVAFAAGMAVAVNPFETTFLNGFWHVFSAGWQEAPAPAPRKRLYFGVRPGAELGFIRAILQVAPVSRTWSLKILTGPTPAGRCDPCVLYLPGGASAADPWLAEILDTVGPFLGDVAVPGAAALRDGIAEAPDADDNESFGQRLCGVLAGIAPERPDWAEEARSRLLAMGASP